MGNLFDSVTDSQERHTRELSVRTRPLVQLLRRACSFTNHACTNVERSIIGMDAIEQRLRHLEESPRRDLSAGAT